MQWKCRESGERSDFEKMGAKVIGQRERGVGRGEWRKKKAWGGVNELKCHTYSCDSFLF